MINRVSRIAAFNPGAKFLILYNNPMKHLKEKQQKLLAFEVFSIMYNHYNAANVIFMFATNIDEYTIFVTNPYRNTNQCGLYRLI